MTACSKAGFLSWYASASRVESTLPCTITWAPISVFGFNNTGFMSLQGSRPQACACSAWARPISPPSTVTAEFSAIFCGLNGTTDDPARTRTRHKPVARTLFPASDVVPCIIIVLADITVGNTFEMDSIEEIQDTHKFTCERKDFKPVPGGMSKVCDLSCWFGN